MNKIKARRIKRILSTNKFKIVMVAIISLFLFTSTGYAILSSVQNIDGSAQIVADKEYVCESKITATYTLNTSWNENDGKIFYNALIIVNNEGTETINDWEIIVKGPNDIVAEASAEVTIDDNGVITMKALSWNNIINPGSSLTLEFRAHTVEENFEPEYIYVNGCLVYGEHSGSSAPGGDSPEVELTGLQILPETYTMAVGEIAPLQAVKTPSNATALLVWSSNNENIVRVNDSGVITAVSPGSATITVASGDITAQSYITVEESSTPPETPLESLTITPSYHQMLVGENYKLSITKNPANATGDIVWSSSDSNIVEVTQDGTITAKAPGNATITVSSGNITAQSQIVVNQNNQLVSISINPTQYQMTVGNTYQLTATKNPTDAPDNLVWTSSDTNIVEVTQDGTITAKAPGNATITVSSGNISAQSYIMVEQNNQLVSITINPAQYQMTVGNTYQLTATKNPTNATGDLVWTSSDSNIVEVDQNGLITAKAPGNATITVSSGEITAQSSITVTEATTSNDVTAVLEQSNNHYWGTLEQGYSTNFKITVTNNSESAINGLELTMPLPEGTNVNFYEYLVSYTNGVVTYNGSINSNATIELQGQLTLPPNFEISGFFPQDCTIVQIR